MYMGEHNKTQRLVLDVAISKYDNIKGLGKG